MTTHPFTPHAPATLVLLAIAALPLAALADTPAPNADHRFVSVGAQADNRHNQEALTTLSLPVGTQAWVQAGAGKSRSDAQAGGYRPGIVDGAVGLTGRALQLTLSASHRADGQRYRQTDVGSSLDWRHGDGNVGLDVSHRQSQATSNGTSGSTTGPTRVKVAGNGVGVHGGLQLTERFGIYGSAMRSHYHDSTDQTVAPAPGGLLGGNPVLAQALLGGTSVVNIDQVALDRSAQVGATVRWDKVAVSGEYTAGQVYGGQGALHGVDVKAAIDVAPGWRVVPGIGRGSSNDGSGHASFASLSATYGW